MCCCVQQKFHADIASHQETLSSVVDDGRALIDSSDVSADSRDFRQNLDSMELHWQNVVQQADQQRSAVDSRLQLWQDYRQLLDQLSQTLDEVDCSIHENPLTPSDREQAKHLLDFYHVGGLIST